MMVENRNEPLVMYKGDGHIGYILLNRPDKRNALNPKVWQALDEAISRAEEDNEARVVILKGEGRSFCAGLDLSPDNEMFQAITMPAGAAQKTMFYREVRIAQQIHTRLERLRQPVIAAIQGHCLGAGLELALCADILLCTADTIFALPEAKLAFITDVGGLQRLSRFVGRGHVREIAFRGHRFDSRKALAIGLVNEICPDEETLWTNVMAMADDIAANPPLAVQGAKDVLLFNEDASLEESLAYNAARSAMIVPSDDQAEAIQSYLEKRTGVFKGA
jgi:enoyl-CoA hydratase